MKRNKQTKKKTQQKQKTKKHEQKYHQEEKETKEIECTETKPKIRTITFQNGEIVADSHSSIIEQQTSISPSPSSSSNSSAFNSYSNSPAVPYPQSSPSFQYLDTPREKSPMEIMNEENQRNIHQLELIQKQISFVFEENRNEIQKEEKKLTNLIVKSHEHISNELKYSFDCDSVVMDLPYVRKPSNVDNLIQLKKQQDEQMKDLVIELNEMFLDCQRRLDHIDEMKMKLFQSIENYNEYTQQFISLVSKENN